VQVSACTGEDAQHLGKCLNCPLSCVCMYRRGYVMQTRTQYEGKLIQVPEALIEEQIGKLTQSLTAQFKAAGYGFHLV